MWRCRMPPTMASGCTRCARFGATAPSKRCTAAWSSPGPGHSPSPCGCPTQAPPAPAPARWISRSGSLAAGSPGTAPAGPTPPPSPSGFSTDEVHRANRKRAQPWETPDYPLLELGLSRSHCEALIAPRRTSRAPAQRLLVLSLPPAWHLGEDALRRTGLFDRAVALERLLNDRRARLRCSASGHPAVVYVIDGYDEPGDDTLVLAAETGHYRPLEPGPQRCDACGQHVTVTTEGRWPAHAGQVYLTRFGRSTKPSPKPNPACSGATHPTAPRPATKGTAGHDTHPPPPTRAAPWTSTRSSPTTCAPSADNGA